MTKVNLKDNIWIEGFDTNYEVYSFKDTICFFGEATPHIYIGKTSEIPEELAKECVAKTRLRNFKNYKTFRFCGSPFTAKESIQSACSDEFCIIYKIK